MTNFFSFFLIFYNLNENHKNWIKKIHRNLSGGKATNGNDEINKDVLNLITVGLLGGYAIRKVKAYNDRIFLSRYRRSYWLGTRYFFMVSYYEVSYKMSKNDDILENWTIYFILFT